MWKLNSLENLKNLSIVGCNVAFIPLDEQKIKIDSEGCPLIKRVKGKASVFLHCRLEQESVLYYDWYEIYEK